MTDKIKGYRELTKDELALINRIKEQGACLETMINELFANPETDVRWVAIAQTHLQQGLMAAIRSVAKPDSF